MATMAVAASFIQSNGAKALGELPKHGEAAPCQIDEIAR